MQKVPINEPPKVYLCHKCQVYFFSFSSLQKPTHSKCAGHNTRLATDNEIDMINKANNMHLAYNRS